MTLPGVFYSGAAAPKLPLGEAGIREAVTDEGN